MNLIELILILFTQSPLFSWRYYLSYFLTRYDLYSRRRIRYSFLSPSAFPLLYSLPGLKSKLIHLLSPLSSFSIGAGTSFQAICSRWKARSGSDRCSYLSLFAVCQYIASFFSGPGELVPDLPGSPIPSSFCRRDSSNCCSLSFFPSP